MDEDDIEDFADADCECGDDTCVCLNPIVDTGDELHQILGEALAKVQEQR